MKGLTILLTVCVIVGMTFGTGIPVKRRGGKCPRRCMNVIRKLKKSVSALTDRVAELEDQSSGGDEWTLLFSAKSGTGVNVLASWEGEQALNADNADADVYKSPLVEDPKTVWDLIKISVFAGGEEVAYFIFNARGASKTSWMSKDRLMGSSAGKLSKHTFNFFSTSGHNPYSRHFFISKSYGGCGQDWAWLIVVDTGKGACAWMERADKPYFLYCTAADACNMIQAPIGDTFTISATLM